MLNFADNTNLYLYINCLLSFFPKLLKIFQMICLKYCNYQHFSAVWKILRLRYFIYCLLLNIFVLSSLILSGTKYCNLKGRPVTLVSIPINYCTVHVVLWGGPYVQLQCGSFPLMNKKKNHRISCVCRADMYHSASQFPRRLNKNIEAYISRSQVSIVTIHLSSIQDNIQLQHVPQNTTWTQH